MVADKSRERYSHLLFETHRATKQSLLPRPQAVACVARERRVPTSVNWFSGSKEARRRETKGGPAWGTGRDETSPDGIAIP